RRTNAREAAIRAGPRALAAPGRCKSRPNDPEHAAHHSARLAGPSGCIGILVLADRSRRHGDSAADSDSALSPITGPRNAGAPMAVVASGRVGTRARGAAAERARIAGHRLAHAWQRGPADTLVAESSPRPAAARLAPGRARPRASPPAAARPLGRLAATAGRVPVVVESAILAHSPATVRKCRVGLRRV